MVIFIGPPGAGKSLQADLLYKRGAAQWISTGQLHREHLDEQASKILSSGDIMPDEITIKLLKDKLATITDKELIILDGFPRRESQTKWLMSEDNPRKLDGVIVIKLDHNHIIERLLLRGRPDDKRDVIEHRLKLYNEEIDPIIEDFKQADIKVMEIDGNGTIEEVYSRVHKALSELGIERLN